MAEEEQAAGEEAAGGSGKKKIILMAILAVVLIGASVGGTLAVLSMTAPEEVAMEGEGEEMKEEMMDKPADPAIYYPLKPPIIVSFDTKGRQRLMQAEITLLTRSNDVIADLETHMPMIRNALVMLLGGQLFEEVQTAEGKELLRVQALQELQRLMEQETGEPGIEQVLFTNLVMQ